MNNLSALNRDKIIANLSSEVYDLVIIGGGVTGAGIALDAASRGLKVALVEKDDFASGTSSKSTKLIHGGLRYLKQFEIGLVREVGRERAIVHRLAPHLVLAEKMLLPLVKGGTYGEFATSVGLWVYDVLAGVAGDDKRRMLEKHETIEMEPLLREDILTGSGFYAEYRTDDARLTIEIIKTAAKFGATSINYVKAVDFIYENKTVQGIVCENTLDGGQFHINAHYVVSAAGPWVDDLRKVDNSLQGKHLFLSKGVHIVVPRDRFPVHHSVYFDVPDGRMIFAIPRHRITYIGTTDTPYQGDINDVPVHQEDVAYLLEAVNNMFPNVDLKIEDVESSWAGLRPLIHEEGKSASEMSRKDEIFESETGLISIAGGKLTGYRKMSERVIDLIVKKYERKFDKNLKKNFTDEIHLTGGPFKGAQEVTTYIEKLSRRIEAYGLKSYYAEYLVANYGKQTEEILKILSTFNNEAEIALARAEAQFTIEYELVNNLLDFFARRTGRLYFNLPSIALVSEPLIKDFAQAFNWSDDRIVTERQKLNKSLNRATVFEVSPQNETTH